MLGMVISGAQPSDLEKAGAIVAAIASDAAGLKDALEALRKEKAAIQSGLDQAAQRWAQIREAEADLEVRRQNFATEIATARLALNKDTEIAGSQAVILKKASADLEKQQAEIAAANTALKQREAMAAALESQTNKRQASLDNQERALSDREAALKAGEEALAVAKADHAAAVERLQAIINPLK